MDLKPAKLNRPKPVINSGKIINLRFYKHIKSGEIYFVNGFAIRESDLVTQVIYTQGYTGTLFTRPVKEFEEKFVIIEKKK